MGRERVSGFSIRLPDTLRALHDRNYRLFFTGQGISLTGTWMQTVALQWLVYRLTGSVVMLAAINLVAGILVIPVSLWGGSLADRFSKRSLLLITQSILMVQAFVLAALVWSGLLQVWHLFLLAIIAGAATAANAPVRQSFIVELVGDKKDLANAIGLNSTTINAAATIGPALGGVAIAAVGEAGAFFVNGLTFTAMIAALLLMRTRPAVPVQEQTGLGSHVKEGFLFAFKHRSLLILFSLVAVAAFLSRPYVLLLPIFADDVLSASAQPLLEFACGGENALFNCQSDNALIFGVLMAAVGVGSVLGALGVASLSKRAVRGRWMLSMYLCFTLLLIGLALSRSFVLSLLLLVGIGFSFVFQNALTNTLVQLISPDHVRGRISSFYSLIFVGMTQLGGIQAGLVGDHLSAPMAVGLGAILCLAYGVIIILRFPHIRKMS